MKGGRRTRPWLEEGTGQECKPGNQQHDLAAEAPATSDAFDSVVPLIAQVCAAPRRPGTPPSRFDGDALDFPSFVDVFERARTGVKDVAGSLGLAALRSR